MDKKITLILLQCLLIIISNASDVSLISINGNLIPVIGVKEGSSFEINLPSEISLASAEFHRKHIIPFQEKLNLFQGPIICFLTDRDKANLRLEESICEIIIPKNEITEGCVSSLFHELGHLYISSLKQNIMKKSNDFKVIFYALKMRDNFVGLGVCGIASALIFATTSKYVPRGYLLPLAYGGYRIIKDIVNGHYYNYYRRLEEEVCDIFMAFMVSNNNEERIKFINQFMTSLKSNDERQSLELQFFTFLTGKTHPSHKKRIDQLTKIKEMQTDQIEELFNKKVKTLLNGYKAFLSMTGLS